MESSITSLESSAWNALAACGIQQTSELSDSFLINTFADLIARVDSKQAWRPEEFDVHVNKQKIVRSLRAFHLQRYLSAPQHINPQLRQKVLSSLAALANLVNNASFENAAPVVEQQSTPARVFKPTHSLARTPRKETALHVAQKENKQVNAQESLPQQQQQQQQAAVTTAPTPVRTPMPSLARPTTPVPSQPPVTPQVTTVVEQAAFARSTKIARTPVRKGRINKDDAAAAEHLPSPTMEITAQLEKLSIAPTAPATQHLRRSPRRTPRPPSPTAAAAPRITAPQPTTVAAPRRSRIRAPSPSPEPAPLSTSTATPALTRSSPRRIRAPSLPPSPPPVAATTPGMPTADVIGHTAALNLASTQQLEAMCLDRERQLVMQELSGINKALEYARENEQRFLDEQRELDAQFSALREREAALLEILKAEGISAPNTPSVITSDNQLFALKAQQQALEEQLELQQRMLKDANNDRRKAITEMTENLTQYSAVLTRLTEQVLARRNNTKTIDLPPETLTATECNDTQQQQQQLPQHELTMYFDDDDDVEVDDVVLLNASSNASSSSSQVLSIHRPVVPRPLYSNTCKEAKEKLIAERQRLLDESERILQQMRRRV